MVGDWRKCQENALENTLVGCEVMPWTIVELLIKPQLSERKLSTICEVESGVVTIVAMPLFAWHPNMTFSAIWVEYLRTHSWWESKDTFLKIIIFRDSSWFEGHYFLSRFVHFHQFLSDCAEILHIIQCYCSDSVVVTVGMRVGRWRRIWRGESKPFKRNATRGCWEYHTENIKRTNKYGNRSLSSLDDGNFDCQP